MKRRVEVDKQISLYKKTALNFDNRTLKLIERVADDNNVNSELLFAILTIEKMNRGGLLNRLVERTISLVFPLIAVKLDLSLGIGQVKISTALKVTDVSPIKLAGELTSLENNIRIVAKLLNWYQSVQPDIVGMVNCYTTGIERPKTCFRRSIYIELVLFSMENSVFKKVLGFCE